MTANTHHVKFKLAAMHFLQLIAMCINMLLTCGYRNSIFFLMNRI